MTPRILFAASANSDQKRPESVPGWTGRGAETFSAADLHMYIDGASEIYRALNVVRVVARRYQREGMPDIVADVFEMKSGADAFGAYHHDIREGEPAGVGQESEYEGTSLAFWKGRFVVYVTAPRPADGIREAVLGIGRVLEAEIREECEAPALLRVLPEQGLQRDWIRYFHNHMSLNLYYSLSEENVLKLGEDTEGLLGRYRLDDGGRLTCLVLGYPSEKAACSAVRSFLNRYKGKPGTWWGARSAGRLAGVVLDAPDHQAGGRKLDELIAAATGDGREESSHE